jgi:hypothetical protein
MVYPKATVTYELRAGVAWLGLNRPDKRNAIGEALLAELEAAMRRAQDEARALVVFDHGPCFSAGNRGRARVGCCLPNPHRRRDNILRAAGGRTWHLRGRRRFGIRRAAARRFASGGHDAHRPSPRRSDRRASRAGAVVDGTAHRSRGAARAAAHPGRALRRELDGGTLSVRCGGRGAACGFRGTAGGPR